MGSNPTVGSIFNKEMYVKIADMLTPQVTPPQAREAIATIVPALTERLGPDVRFVGDMLALLKALAPADYDETCRMIDDYAAHADRAAAALRSEVTMQALAGAATPDPAQAELELDDAPGASDEE